MTYMSCDISKYLCCVTARAKWIEKSGPGVKKIARKDLKNVFQSPQYISTSI